MTPLGPPDLLRMDTSGRPEVENHCGLKADCEAFPAVKGCSGLIWQSRPKLGWMSAGSGTHTRSVVRSGSMPKGAHGGQGFRCWPLEQLGAVDDVGHE